MNQRQNRLISAADAGIIHVVSLKDPPPRVTAAAKRLTEVVKEAKAAEQQQRKANYQRRAPQYSLNGAKRILFLKHLGPVVADGLEMFAGFPGIEETLRAPRVKDKPQKILEAAGRVRGFAEAHEQEFIDDRNYSPDFLEQFDLAMQNLEAAARADQGVARAKYSQATREMQDEIARVRRALGALDARMREAYLDDPKKLKLWRHASRMPAKRGRPKKRKPRGKRSDPGEGTV